MIACCVAARCTPKCATASSIRTTRASHLRASDRERGTDCAAGGGVVNLAGERRRRADVAKRQRVIIQQAPRQFPIREYLKRPAVHAVARRWRSGGCCYVEEQLTRIANWNG